jgi:hypothetical protein
MAKKIIPYEQIRPLLDNGDLVLFRGSGLISTLILWFCSIFNRFKFTKFSHIGFVVVDSGRVMLFESTTLTYKISASIAYETDKYYEREPLTQKGVRLVPLSELIKLYNGQIWIRRLITPRTPLMIEQMNQYISVNLGKPYEKHIIELMGSVADDVDWYKEQNNTDMFCSELVAGLYKRWSMLPPSIPSNEYKPDNFAENDLVDDWCYMTDEQRIK